MTYLDEVKARVEAATPGPWAVSLDDRYSGWPYISQVKGHSEGCVGSLTPYFEEDAEFIAHAREDIPELLRRLEIAERVLEKIVGTREYSIHKEPWKLLADDALSAIRSPKEEK